MRRARFVCKRKYKSIFQCAAERAKSRKRRREQDIHSRMRWYCIWLVVPMLNDDRRSRLYFICESWRTSTRKVDWVYSNIRVPRHFLNQTQKVLRRVSHVSNFYHVCMRFRERRMTMTTKPKALLHLPSIPGLALMLFNGKPYILPRDCAKQIGKAGAGERDRSGESNLVLAGSALKVLCRNTS